MSFEKNKRNNQKKKRRARLSKHKKDPAKIYNTDKMLLDGPGGISAIPQLAPQVLAIKFDFQHLSPLSFYYSFFF